MGNGCSFATPLVSGEAALLRSLVPGESPVAVREQIRAAVDPIDDLPLNKFYRGKLGSGRIYLPAALDAITGIAPSDHPGPVLRAFPNPSAASVLFSPVPAVGRASSEGSSGVESLFSARVFDSGGRLVRILAPSAHLVWDGAVSDGRRASPGTYFIRIDTADRGANGPGYSTRVTLLR